MAEVSLARLLKIKSRFTNEYKTQIAILHRENSRLSTSTSKIDRLGVFIRIGELREIIIKIKSIIAQTNWEIFPQIYKLQELRGYLAQIKSLDTKDGKKIEYAGYGWENPVEQIWDAYITQDKIDSIEADIVKELGKTQDIVDAFNATKIATVPDEWL